MNFVASLSRSNFTDTVQGLISYSRSLELLRSSRAQPAVAQQVLALIEDRRLFWARFDAEFPDRVRTSLDNLRHELTSIRKDCAPQAEKVHGIRRCWLDQYGLPALEVAEAMNRVFGTGVVFSDAPAWEEMWTRRLYDAVGVRRTWRIGDAIPLLRATAPSKDDNHWLTFHLLDTRLHRADADALVLADGYVEMRRRRELAALLDKASQASPAAQGASHTANPTEKGADNE